MTELPDQMLASLEILSPQNKKESKCSTGGERKHLTWTLLLFS